MRRNKIGEILIENGFMTGSQLEAGLKIQERDCVGLLGIILLNLEYITPDQLMRSLDIQKKIQTMIE